MREHIKEAYRRKRDYPGGNRGLKPYSAGNAVGFTLIGKPDPPSPGTPWSISFFGVKAPGPVDRNSYTVEWVLQPNLAPPAHAMMLSIRF